MKECDFVNQRMTYEMADEIADIYNREMKDKETCDLHQVIDQVARKHWVMMTPELRNGLEIGMKIMSNILVHNN